MWCIKKISSPSILREKINSRAFSGFKHSPYVLMLFLILLLTGCASVRERAAFRELREYPAASQLSPVSQSPGTDIPYENPSSLEEMLIYAALNNPELRAAFEEWKASLEKVPQLRSLPDPKLQYGYFIRKVETRVGAQRQKFGISQSLPFPSKLHLKADAALEEAEKKRQNFELLKLNLLTSVKKNYMEYYYITQAIKITGENIQLLKQMEGVAQTAYKVGKAPFSSVIKAQLELGKLENRIQSLKDMKRPQEAKINALLSRSTLEPLPMPKLPVDVLSEISPNKSSRLLLDHNPELRILELEIARNKTLVSLAKKNHLPDISVGLDYIDTDDAMMSDVTDSGKNPILAMVSISIPLWFHKYKAGVREAEANYQASLDKRKNRENQLVAELDMAHFAARDADRKINLYKNTLIPKAREALEVARKAFTTGKGDFLELVDSERALLEFDLNLERARTDKGKYLAEIEKLTGKNLSSHDFNKNKKEFAPFSNNESNQKNNKKQEV